MSQLQFFCISFAWNYGLGMTYVVIPLYAHAQGLSGSEIGILFSLPVAGQIAVNLVGGAYVDRIGGLRIMRVSAMLMCLAALLYTIAQGFHLLLIAQCMMVLSRASFWPAAWAFASGLPGPKGVPLGRLNAVTNVGQIAGTASCGFLLAATGYAVTFAVLAGAGGVSLAVLAHGIRRAPPPEKTAQQAGIFRHFGPLLRTPIIYYAILCAYLSALPFSLSMSFYPLLLKHFGFTESVSGVLIALRAVGATGAGLLAARYVRTGPASHWPVYAGVAVATAVGATPLFPNSMVIASLMLLVGLGSGLMTLYFQITISEISSPEERGSAMALGGLGWGISHLTTPVIMGFLADQFGVVTGFYVLGGLALASVAALATTRRAAFSRTRFA